MVPHLRCEGASAIITLLDGYARGIIFRFGAFIEATNDATVAQISVQPQANIAKPVICAYLRFISIKIMI